VIDPATNLLAELYTLSDRLSAARGLTPVLAEVLSAAITLTDCEMGNVGLYNQSNEDFNVVVFQGFSDEYVERMRTQTTPVKSGPSARALAGRRRVIVPDVYEDPAVEDFLPVVSLAGFSSMQATPILSRDGEPIGTICTYRRDTILPSRERLELLDLYSRLAADAIEREQAQVSLRRSEERFRKLHELTLQLSGVSGWQESLDEILDATCSLLDADAGVLRLIEDNQGAYPAHAWRGIGQEWKDHFVPLSAELDAEAPSRHAISRGQPIIIKDMYAHPGFKRHEAIVRNQGFESALAIPLINQQGEPIGGMCVFWMQPHEPSAEQLQVAQLYARLASDTIERLARESEMARTEHLLRDALSTKDHFLGMVSHELRTPMTMIRGLSSVLRRNPDLGKDALKEVYRDLGDASERLYRLIENMLVLARLEVGQAPATELLLVDKLLSTTAERLRGEMPHLKLSMGPLPYGTIVACNRQYIEQVLRNLVENAHKYSKAEAPVELEATAEDDVVRFSVLDRGIGLKNPESVFQPVRRETTAEQTAPGLGLGLAVCRTLLEAQGGAIWAEQRPGGGSVFNFTLQRARELESVP
jgi:signal transduction histidine kinase